MLSNKWRCILTYNSEQVFSSGIWRVKLLRAGLSWFCQDLLTCLGVNWLSVDLRRPQMGRLEWLNPSTSLSSSSWNQGQSMSFSWGWHRARTSRSKQVCLRISGVGIFAHHHSTVTEQVQEADAKITKMGLNVSEFCCRKELCERKGGRSLVTLGYPCNHDVGPSCWIREGRWVG